MWILLAILLLQVVPDHPFCPYYADDGEFVMNYTGIRAYGTPTTVLTLDTDSLDMDSLLLLYPGVAVVDSFTFWSVIEREFNESP